MLTILLCAVATPSLAASLASASTDCVHEHSTSSEVSASTPATDLDQTHDHASHAGCADHGSQKHCGAHHHGCCVSPLLISRVPGVAVFSLDSLKNNDLKMQIVSEPVLEGPFQPPRVALNL